MFDSLRLDFLTKSCALPLLSFTLRFPSTWLTSRERNVIIHRENMTREEGKRREKAKGRRGAVNNRGMVNSMIRQNRHCVSQPSQGRARAKCGDSD